MFLLAEGHFKLQQYDDCLQVANKMIELFPESELTGYAMVHLGQIYELNNRHEDAIGIYKTVMKSFPNRDLGVVARNALEKVEM